MPCPWDQMSQREMLSVAKGVEVGPFPVDAVPGRVSVALVPGLDKGESFCHVKEASPDMIFLY